MAVAQSKFMLRAYCVHFSAVCSTQHKCRYVGGLRGALIFGARFRVRRVQPAHQLK
jgi:hypothetical protein